MGSNLCYLGIEHNITCPHTGKKVTHIALDSRGIDGVEEQSGKCAVTPTYEKGHNQWEEYDVPKLNVATQLCTESTSTAYKAVITTLEGIICKSASYVGDTAIGMGLVATGYVTEDAYFAPIRLFSTGNSASQNGVAAFKWAVGTTLGLGQATLVSMCTISYQKLINDYTCPPNTSGEEANKEKRSYICLSSDNTYDEHGMKDPSACPKFVPVDNTLEIYPKSN